jgi:hypothetical protein
MIRTALRLVAALVTFVIVSAQFNLLEIWMLSSIEGAGVATSRALMAGCNVLHVAGPFVGFLAGAVIALYPALKRRRLLRPLAWIVVAGVVAAGGEFIWRILPTDPFATADPPLARQLAALTLDAPRTEPLDLRLRGTAGLVSRATTTIDSRMTVDPGRTDPLSFRMLAVSDLEQTIVAVDAEGRLHLRLRWPAVSRQMWMEGQEVPREQLGSEEGLLTLTVEGVQDPTGAIRDFAVHSTDPNVEAQQRALYESAINHDVLVMPQRPVHVGDTWPVGARDFPVPGGGTVRYAMEARLAGTSLWQGQAVAVIDLMAGQPVIETDQERRTPPKLVDFHTNGRSVVAVADGRLLAQASTVRLTGTDTFDGRPVDVRLFAALTMEQRP